MARRLLVEINVDNSSGCSSRLTAIGTEKEMNFRLKYELCSIPRVHLWLEINCLWKSIKTVRRLLPKGEGKEDR